MGRHYFKKNYKLLVSSIAVRSQCHYHTASSHYQHAQDLSTTLMLQPNQVVELAVIDILEETGQIIEAEAQLQVSMVFKGRKQVLGVARFDLQRQKVTPANSSEFYQMALRGGEGAPEGVIQYKFIAANTVEITGETYKQCQLHANQITVQEQALSDDAEYQNVLRIVEEKDKVIGELEGHIKKLTVEMKKGSTSMREKSMSRESSHVSFNVNFKPSQKLEQEHRRLRRDREELKDRVAELQGTVKEMERDKELMEKRIDAMVKAQEVSRLREKEMMRMFEEEEERRREYEREERKQDEVQRELSKELSELKRKMGEKSQLARREVEEARKAMEEGRKSRVVEEEKPIQEEKKEASLAVVSESKEPSSGHYMRKSRYRGEEDELTRQIRVASRFEDLKAEKEKLLERLKGSVSEIDLLTQKLQVKQTTIRRLTDELQTIRKNISPEGVMAKIEAIRASNLKAINELKARGRISSQQQIHTTEKENLQIEIEIKEGIIQDLKHSLEFTHSEYTRKIKSLETKLVEIEGQLMDVSFQKRVNDEQLFEMKAAIQKQNKNNISSQNLSEQIDKMGERVKSLARDNDILETNLKNEKEAFRKLKGEHQNVLYDNRQKQGELERMKTMQVDLEMMTKRANNYQEEIRKYDNKFRDIKNFALQVEQTFNNHFQDKDQATLERELTEKIKLFEELIEKAEREYFEGRMLAYQNLRRQATENTIKVVEEELRKIEDDEGVPVERKQRAKELKQAELERQQKQELQKIEDETAKLQRQRDEDIMQIDLQALKTPKRIEFLESKIKGRLLESQLLIRQNEDMKMQIAQLKEEMKLRRADTLPNPALHSQESIEEKRSMMMASRMLSSSVIGASKDQNERLELRAKLFEEWQKKNQDAHRRYTEAASANTQLKIEKTRLEGAIEKHKRDIDYMERKGKNELEAKEKEMGKMQAFMEKQIEAASNRAEKLGKDILELKEEREGLVDSCSQLERTLTELAHESDHKDREIQRLNQLIGHKEVQIEEYDKGTDTLMGTLQDIRRQCDEKVDTMTQLLQERNQQFVRIEKVKDTEIQKLGHIVDEYVVRLQNETDEALKLKNENTNLTSYNEAITKEVMELKESLSVERRNHEQESGELREKNAIYEEVNLDLEKNMMELGEQFNNLEEQIATLTIQKETLEKELTLFKEIDKKLKQMEQQRDAEKEQNNKRMEDKQEQIRKNQLDLVVIQERIKILAEENEKMLEGKRYSEAEAETWKEKHNEKALEVIKGAEEKSLVTIEKAKKEQELEEISQKMSRLEEDVKKMEQDYKQLIEQHEALAVEHEQLLNKAPSNVRISKGGSVSREGEVEKFRHSAGAGFGLTRKQSINRSASVGADQSQPQDETLLQEVAEPVEIGVVEAKERSFEIPHDQQLSQEAAERMEIKSEHSGRSGSRRSHSRNASVDQRSHSRTGSVDQRGRSMDRSDNVLMVGSSNEEMMQRVQDLAAEREELHELVNELTAQLNELKQQGNLQSKGTEGKAIMITEEGDPAPGGSFSLGKIVSDSRELVTTQEHTKQSFPEAAEYELIVEELKREKEEVAVVLEEERENVERLIKTIEELELERDRLAGGMEELRRQHGDKMTESECFRKEQEQKVEQLLAELMEKETLLTNTLHQLQEAEGVVQDRQQEIAQLQVQMEERERQLGQVGEKVTQLKMEFRRYEEEAELEILTLREKFDEAIQVGRDKDDQITELAEKFLNLQEGVGAQNGEMNRLQGEIDRHVRRNLSLEAECSRMEKDKEEWSEGRKSLMKRIHELEVSLVRGHEELMEANKNASLAISKSNIKIEGMEQEVANARQRMEEKERVVGELKQQIALYNEECHELKEANGELDYELQRVTREMKEIMVNYEKELEEMSKKVVSAGEGLKSGEEAVKEKEKLLGVVRGEMRESERERLRAVEELSEMKTAFDRLKAKSQKEYGQKCSELQIQHNQTQMLRAQLVRREQDVREAEAKAKEANGKHSRLCEDYNAKMGKYEDGIEELSKQIKALANRPTQEAHDKAKFDCELYRTRVEELEGELRQQRGKGGEDAVGREFRRYRANQEARVSNLEAEMENYGSKINEMEEANFYLRKENADLRAELVVSKERAEAMSEEVQAREDEVEDLRQEVEYYKSQRKQGLTKLLNETYD